MEACAECKNRGNLILENRRNLSVSAVRDVESFDTTRIVLITEDGILTVTGKQMRVKKLSSESGEAQIEGEIEGCVYSHAPSGEGFFKKVFK